LLLFLKYVVEHKIGRPGFFDWRFSKYFNRFQKFKKSFIDFRFFIRIETSVFSSVNGNKFIVNAGFVEFFLQNHRLFVGYDRVGIAMNNKNGWTCLFDVAITGETDARNSKSSALLSSQRVSDLNRLISEFISVKSVGA